MLVRFTVENCLSFRDRVELSMIASEEVLDHPEHVIRGDGENDVPILKLGVIYGANASGKSNLVKAMLMATGFILDPRRPNERISLAPFKLDPSCRDRPTRFEFEIKHKDRYFAYGFTVSSEHVEEEWLFEVGRTVEDRIFERKRNHFDWGRLKFSGPDEKSKLEHLAELILPNRLFLSECRERNVRDKIPAAEDIINALSWFETKPGIALHELNATEIPLRVQSDDRFRRQLIDYLRCFDTGIEAIELEPIEPQPRLNDFARAMKERESLAGPVWDDDHPYRFWARDERGTLKAWKLVTRHCAQAETDQYTTFDMSEESDGTRRLVHLVPYMIAMLKGDGVFVIDELGRSLHPEIAHSYLANFLKYSAGRSSQLIVTTHDTSLLRQHFLRRDEVWFVEKGNDGASRLIALEEYKDVENSKDLQQDYLLGRFGGVPVIQDFSWLGEEHGEST